MRRVRFIARGVLVLSLVLALNAPAYGRGRKSEEPPQKNPVIKLIKKLVLAVCGDGLITPIP